MLGISMQWIVKGEVRCEIRRYVWRTMRFYLYAAVGAEGTVSSMWVEWL